MYIAGIAPAESPAGSRSKRRDEPQDERQPGGFSPLHVILDLSLEAMNRIGYRSPTVPRTPPPVLFVYDGGGSFAYDEAARRYEQARPAAMPVDEPLPAEETLTIPEAPAIPARVSFDGMLGGGRV